MTSRLIAATEELEFIKLEIQGLRDSQPLDYGSETQKVLIEKFKLRIDIYLDAVKMLERIIEEELSEMNIGGILAQIGL